MPRTSLTSLHHGYRAFVFGGTGGIGGALVRALDADERCAAIFSASRSVSADFGKVTSLAFDLADEDSIIEAVAATSAAGPLDLVIVATGLLHDATMRPERTWKKLEPETLARAFQINAIGPAIIAKHALGALARDRRAVFAALSARVSSISDNQLGGWHAYRASKAALNMLIRNFSIELATRNREALCIALHPGTVDTAMSRPFQANVLPERLFTADRSAEHLLAVIDALKPADSGKLFAWDGSEIPF